METLPNGFTLEVPPGAFPLSTDSMALADFVKLPKNAAVLDLGSGCGTLGLLLASGNRNCRITGVEITEAGHDAALRNIRRNGLEGRMESVCADLRGVPSLFPAGSFSLCLSNPPYFSGGPASKSLTAARREDLCTPEQLFAAAAHALKFGGDFCLVHRPERLGELIAQGDRVHFACKRLRLIRHREDGPVALVLLAFRKSGKQGLQLEECALFDKSGNPTPHYNRIYHIKEA